jgi:hypothetical protein
MDSLCQVFRQAPDPRDSNTRYRTGPVLTLIAMALLAGRREIAEIARFANTLTHPQRRRLTLPLKKGTGGFYKVPGYDVFYQVLTRMDPEAFARILNDWLARRAGSLCQVVGQWVWIEFGQKQPRYVTAEPAQLGFPWNRRRQVWQHPCGQFRTGIRQDPREKYPTCYPAD